MNYQLHGKNARIAVMIGPCPILMNSFPFAGCGSTATPFLIRSYWLVLGISAELIRKLFI